MERGTGMCAPVETWRGRSVDIKPIFTGKKSSDNVKTHTGDEWTLLAQ